MIGQVLNDPGMFALALPFVVDTLPPYSHNIDAGLMRGDRIIALDGKAIAFTQDSRQLLQDYRMGTVVTDVVRGNDTISFCLEVDSLGLLGIVPQIPGIRTKEYTFASAIPAGFTMTFDNIGGYLRDLRLVSNPSTGAYKSVGSFIAIGQVFPSVWNWTAFFSILALLSIMLGVMNLIPIPALDGGHIVITVFEIITGRKPSERFLMVTQMIGMILLVMLMLLAFGNDIGRLMR